MPITYPPLSKNEREIIKEHAPLWIYELGLRFNEHLVGTRRKLEQRASLAIKYIAWLLVVICITVLALFWYLHISDDVALYVSALIFASMLLLLLPYRKSIMDACTRIIWSRSSQRITENLLKKPVQGDRLLDIQTDVLILGGQHFPIKHLYLFQERESFWILVFQAKRAFLQCLSLY